METIWQTHRIKHEKINREEEMFKISHPSDVVAFLHEELKDLDREHFVLLTLNTKNFVNSFSIIHIGSVNASIVDISLVLKTAILNNATSLIVAHNHPTGFSKPSPQDIEITERLNKACEIVHLTLLDHIVVGDGNYTSLKTEGFF